jgi:hypothetical protein
VVPDTHERWPGSKLSEAICEDSRYEVLDEIGHVGVVAVRDELIVSSGDRIASADFRRDLRETAEPVERRNLGGPRATAATGFERCRQARIFVVSHPHAITSETAVARSLSREGARLRPDLVSCGYAYATLDNVPPFVFEQAIDRLAPSVGVVSPAGNEQSGVPHWPAAFERVIGVAALQGPPDAAKRAAFSNYGDWVTCSTGGVDLVSTFPPGKWELEEVPGVVQDFGEFAFWSGTSFATPRVTAQAAADLAAGSAATGAAAAGNVSKAADAATDLGDGGAAGVGRMLKLP